MKNYLPGIIAILGTIATVFGPSIQHWIAAHPESAAIVAGLYAILAHIAPSPVGNKG